MHGCVHALCRTGSRRSPSDEGLAAVLAGSAWPLDGDVPVQTRSADQAASPVNVTELVHAGDCPDVLIHVAGLVQPAPAGQVIIRRELRPYLSRCHGQFVVPERLAKRFQRLCAGIFLANRKGIAPIGRPAAVPRVGGLPTPSLPAALDSADHRSPHTPSRIGRPAAEALCRGAGSRLCGSRNDSAHLRFHLSNRRAPCQSSEHADRNLARRWSCRVLRLWQFRYSQRRLSGVNARSIAAGPSVLTTSIASLCAPTPPDKR